MVRHACVGYLFAAGKEDLNMVYVNMEMPEEMEAFAMPPSKEGRLKRNAMILYPYVHDGIISYGRAAEILGIFRMDLIVLYSKLVRMRSVKPVKSNVYG